MSVFTISVLVICYSVCVYFCYGCACAWVFFFIVLVDFKTSGFIIIIIACVFFYACTWVVRSICICILVCYACALSASSMTCLLFLCLSCLLCLHLLWLIYCLCLICFIYICGCYACIRLSAIPSASAFIMLVSVLGFFSLLYQYY